MKARLRVACVGAGYFSQFHYESWARIDEVVPYAACDIDIDKAKATGLPAYDDLATMLREVRPDILDVILPPSAQAEAIKTALDNRVRIIICQKPFCTSLEEAQEVIDEADTLGATIIIHENFRFQPWFRLIKSLVDEGALGQILQATYRLRPGDGQGQDAYLDRQPYFRKMPRLLMHETGVHYVDTFRYLFGNPTALYADVRKINPVIAGEDAGYVVFDHPDGIRSLLDGNRLLDHAADNLRCTMGEALIEGTEGALTLKGDGSLHLRAKGDVSSKQILQADNSGRFGGDCVTALQKHVISGLLEERPLENTARDYLQVMKIEKAIYASAKEGRKIPLEGQ